MQGASSPARIPSSRWVNLSLTASSRSPAANSAQKPNSSAKTTSFPGKEESPSNTPPASVELLPSRRQSIPHSRHFERSLRSENSLFSFRSEVNSRNV